MTTDPDKLLRISHAHVTMATDLPAAIVRAGERRAATLAAGGALDLADAVFATDCLAAHVETNEAMLRATEGDYPAESVARAQRANQRLAEALAEARAGLERGDDPRVVHTRIKLLVAVVAMQHRATEIGMAMSTAEAAVGAQPAERTLYGRTLQIRELRLDLQRLARGRLTHAAEIQSATVATRDTEGPMVAILPSADGTPVVRDVVLNAEGRWSDGNFTTLSEDDGEP